MTIVKLLKESDLLIKGASKTIKNETKEKKGGYLHQLLVYQEIYQQVKKQNLKHIYNE